MSFRKSRVAALLPASVVLFAVACGGTASLTDDAGVPGPGGSAGTGGTSAGAGGSSDAGGTSGGAGGSSGESGTSAGAGGTSAGAGGNSAGAGGSAGSDGGTTCGGPTRRACPMGQWCEFLGTGCSATEGTCQRGWQDCEQAPVCGCDGKTYDNACRAAEAIVDVAHYGVCAAASCSLGGVTYADGATVPSADCNACKCTAGRIACTMMQCPTTPCGGRAGNTCKANEYCAYAAGQSCGAADAQATCKIRPQGCTTEYAPVCGCDGKTYSNTCAAASAGSGVDRTGPCGGQGRSCVVKGVTYPDGASNIPAEDGCNVCSCTDGNLGCTKKACVTPKTCGGFVGSICSASEYCAYVVGQRCGAADASSTCKPRPSECPLVLSYVCGCDGNTYGNDCEAAKAGAGVMSTGECPLR